MHAYVTFELFNTLVVNDKNEEKEQIWLQNEEYLGCCPNY